MQKIVTLKELLNVVRQLRQAGRKIVFTNGCFDLIHPGHIQYLQKARALGDCLIVGLNSDHSVRELKGDSRPILTELERAQILAGLESVSYVTIFDESTPLSLIQALLPDVLVKGGDWGTDQIVGRAEVEASGGKVLSLPFESGQSTTSIIQRILENYGRGDPKD
jgi:rfaE bifunctional protein nucleotidyltransferase chain/domain